MKSNEFLSEGEIEQQHGDTKPWAYWGYPERVAKKLYQIHRGQPIDKSAIVRLWKEDGPDRMTKFMLKPDVAAILSAYEQMSDAGPLFQQGMAEGVAETLPMDDAVKVLRQYGAGHFKTTSNELHFYKNGQPMSVDLIWGNEGERSVNLSQLNSATRQLKGQGVAEAGPFSYGAKKPRKGSVAANAEQKRKEQERDKQPIEPRDQRVGVAKVNQGVAEGILDSMGDEIKHGVKGIKRQLAGKPSRQDVKDKYRNKSIAARHAGDKEEADKNADRWARVHTKTNNAMIEQGVAEGLEDKIAQLKKDHDTAVHWSKNDTNPHKREAARQKAEKIKAHLEKQYKQGVAEGEGEPERKQQTKTKSKFNFDPFQKQKDQPIAKADPLDDLKKNAGMNQPEVNIKKASQSDTLKKTAGLGTPEMGDMLSKLRNIEIDPDLDAYPDQDPSTELSTKVNTQNLPAIAGDALQAAGTANPDFHQVANLPGNISAMIRQLGKTLFGSFTSTPTSDIYVVANLGGKGPNSSQEVNAVANFVQQHGDDRGPGDIDFDRVMPGYKAQVHFYSAAGIRWMLVKDFAGQYIYAWPESDSHDATGAIGNSKQHTPRLK